MLLADGTIVTASACQNADLLFAIRGGGGGTYGVVLSMTIKAYDTKPAIGQVLTMTPLGNNTSDLLDAVTDIYSGYPALSDAGYSGYGSWGIASPMPLFGNATKGYIHTFATMGRTLQEAQDGTEPLLKTLRKYNGTSLLVSVKWYEFPTYAAYYNTLSGSHQPVSDGNSAMTSRMFDHDSLVKRKDNLREMMDVVAGTEEQYASNNVLLVGGGAVLKPQPNSGLDPAWRSTYLVSVSARGWQKGTDSDTIQSIQHDITYTKGGAMRRQTPGLGSYLNEVR